ncbi:MAG: class I SAM-dependent methyltransferase [Nitrospirae bacterium]|nr:class I SAM-dependent methyltransferase [Nitrospirota bacterium]
MGTNYYSPLKESHDVKYGDSPRIEIANLITWIPENILEIGCGTGATGQLLKQKFPNLFYKGIELDKTAAELASKRLDNVVVADINRFDAIELGIEKESFDLIICADVLEHLYDPWKTLHDLRDCLRPDGKLIASIPNVQNIDLILQLVNGNWSYAKHGLLDATHIRFFTLNEIYKLFNGTRYNVIHCFSNRQPGLEEQGWPKDLDLGKIVLKNISLEEAASFFTFQYFVVAEKNRTPAENTSTK